MSQAYQKRYSPRIITRIYDIMKQEVVMIFWRYLLLQLSEGVVLNKNDV